MSKNTYKAPRIGDSKKACKCDETGTPIKKWEKVLIDPADGIKVYCQESDKFKKFSAKNAPKISNTGDSLLGNVDFPN